MKEQYTQLAEMYYQVTFEEFLEQSGITERSVCREDGKAGKRSVEEQVCKQADAEKEKLELSDKAYKEKI